MTSPRASYGGGYYSAPSFPDTPIYDSLVAERGTPQIAPIRVPAAYDPALSSSSHLPALPSALPALPSAPVPAYQGQQQHTPAYGYPYQQQMAAAQPVPLQHAPAPYVPQQAAARGYAAPQPMRPVATTGYEAMRPAAPRPMQAPVPAQAPYEDPYSRQYQGRGY
ncbi:hypothetical protein LG634_17965 [Streptomyces bambusae]|uniref:DUF6643 family protein n=1 Tax=Streptomyces bambusae TaxID=1550616 RepID=UPI001CFD44C7|nr:DUF6643 family protein [Streptomyces bambusae]MCB5166718.1 hypothetical protein [Streptomyces bambusae]